MKNLITGAGGNLGRALVPALLEAGHEVRLMDFRALDTKHEFVQGDVRNFADVQRAVKGVDAIVHAAALHGIHLGKWTPQDFWAINVTGTFNVFEAAREASVKRVVLCSTMGVYGGSGGPTKEAWGVVTEDLPCQPGDIYGMSKWLCEDMARFYSRRHGITTIALRLGMFVPEGSLESYGFRLLFGGVDDRDVAQATLLSLSHQPENDFEFFNIMADVPFAKDDAPTLMQDPTSVIERYYKGTSALAEKHNLDLKALIWGRTLWPVDKAKQILGYQPRYNFDGFLDALKRGDKDYYPYQGLPWWGV